MVSIDQLSDNNFLNVYCIATEIKRGLEITPYLKVHIPESYIYNPNYPCLSNIRYQTIDYLKNIGEIEEYHKVDHGRIGISVFSQDKFFSLCNKLANIYNDRFTISNSDKPKIDSLEAKQDEENEDNDGEEEEDCFSYDGGVSSGYENTDLELFILKKILLDHKQRDDAGFCAKELSFNNNSLEDICRVINRLIEDKILYLSANSSPERDGSGMGGIETKQGFINWDLVKELDKDPEKMSQENNFVNFDTFILDEIKLKGRIDIAIDEFMNDKVFTPLGYLLDKSYISEELSKIKRASNHEEDISKNIFPESITLPYPKQREIVLRMISKFNTDGININLTDDEKQEIDLFKTLLALEKENFLRIKELGGSPIYTEKEGFIGKWKNEDKPFAKIEIIKKGDFQQEIARTEKLTAYTTIENGIGYFKFNKRGEKIKIGGVNTRHFRLLRILCDPVNSARTIDGIFDAIKLPKDKKDTMLNNFGSNKPYLRKKEIIQYTIKELQGIKSLQKKLKYEFEEDQKTLRLNVI